MFYKVMTDIGLSEYDINGFNEGDIVQAVYPAGDSCLFIKMDNEWRQLTILSHNDESRKLNIYNLNKQFVSSLNLMETPEEKEKEKLISNWANGQGNFFLLYGKEISYFTIFKKYQFPEYTQETLGEAVISCLEHLGDIYTIDINNENNSIEIWIKYNDEPTCLYLFNWDEGVVNYCG
jgi:hypothetical protein